MSIFTKIQKKSHLHFQNLLETDDRLVVLDMANNRVASSYKSSFIVSIFIQVERIYLERFDFDNREYDDYYYYYYFLYKFNVIY
jgi:hypothetical protein